MEIIATRFRKSPNATLSKVGINDNVPIMFMLEDKDRGLLKSMPLAEIKSLKVSGKTAIPEGRYEVNYTWSPRFKRYTLQIMDVPGYAGIRIHPGNTHLNTEGCPLPGIGWSDKGVDLTIFDSRTANNHITQLVKNTLLKEKVYITFQSKYEN